MTCPSHCSSSRGGDKQELRAGQLVTRVKPSLGGTCDHVSPSPRSMSWRRGKAADSFLSTLLCSGHPHRDAPVPAKNNMNSRPRPTPRSSSPLVYDEMKRLPHKQAPGTVWDAGPGWHGPHPRAQGLRRTEVPAAVSHSFHLPDASRQQRRTLSFGLKSRPRR